MKDMTGVANQRFFTCFKERLRSSHIFTSLKRKNQIILQTKPDLPVTGCFETKSFRCKFIQSRCK